MRWWTFLLRYRWQSGITDENEQTKYLFIKNVKRTRYTIIRHNLRLYLSILALRRISNMNMHFNLNLTKYSPGLLAVEFLFICPRHRYCFIWSALFCRSRLFTVNIPQRNWKLKEKKERTNTRWKKYQTILESETHRQTLDANISNWQLYLIYWISVALKNKIATHCVDLCCICALDAFIAE